MDEQQWQESRFSQSQYPQSAQQVQQLHYPQSVHGALVSQSDQFVAFDSSVPLFPFFTLFLFSIHDTSHHISTNKMTIN